MLLISRQYNPNGTRERYPDGRPRLGSSMGGTGGGPSTLGGGGLNGGSPTSFDIPATELEAARPQVIKRNTFHYLYQSLDTLVFV